MRQSEGRILLGNNTGGGVVMLWLIRLLCVEVWISTGLPCTNTCSWPHAYSIL